MGTKFMKVPLDPLPCPFCGKQPKKVPFENAVACANWRCPCKPLTEVHRTFGKAVAAWNRRKP